MSETPNPQRIGRSIVAVLTGAVAGVLLSLGTDMLLRVAGIFSPLGHSMANPLFALAAAYRIAYGVLGSYIGARIAPYRPMTHAMVLGCWALWRMLSPHYRAPGWAVNSLRRNRVRFDFYCFLPLYATSL